MEINMFFGGMDSVKGFESTLLKEIEEKVHIHSFLLTVKAHDEEDVYGDNCLCVNYDICEHNRYRECYNLEEMQPLSREILEAMREYEGTALEMFQRNYERNIYTIDEAKHYYLEHLRFWNHMLLTQKINFICYSNIPHHVHDYIIYALGKIYQIPMCVFSDTSIQPRLAYGTDLLKLHAPVESLYQKYRTYDKIELAEDLEHYYQALLYENEGLDNGAVHRGMSRKEHIAVRRRNFTRDFEWKHLLKINGSAVKQGLKAFIKRRDTKALYKAAEKLGNNRNIQKRAKLKLRSMRGVSYYDSMAQLPVFTEKYVIFFLHLQPEATTLPQGGVFANQELMLQILAHSLKKQGIKLYVKEHFVQPYRDKYFYDGLNSMDNLTLIQTDVDSKELAKHSIATASCNGTIMLESIFNHKPTFIFGATPFRSAPGVYYIGSVEECDSAVAEIIKERPISSHDVRAYLKAFEECSVRAYLDMSKYETDSTLAMEEGRHAYRDVIVRMLTMSEQEEWNNGKYSV